MSGSQQSPTKLCFVALDDGEREFYVQYNPTALKIDKGASWKEAENMSTETGLEFTKVEPRTISMELFFDTTQATPGSEKAADDSSEYDDVREKWVNHLMSFTNADFEAKDVKIETGEEKSSKSGKTGHPTRVKLLWKGIDIICVVEKVGVNYTMFASDGTPLRASVSLSLKEWMLGKAGAGTASSSDVAIGGERVQIVAPEAGQTIFTIAEANGCTWQELAEFNDIDDPLNIPPDKEIVVPGGV